MIEKGIETKLDLFPVVLVDTLRAIIQKNLEYFKTHLRSLDEWILDAVEYDFIEYLEYCATYECHIMHIYFCIDTLFSNQKYEYVIKIVNSMKDSSELLRFSAVFKNEHMIDWLIDNVQSLDKYKTYQGMISASRYQVKDLFKYLINSSRFTNDEVVKAFASMTLEPNFDIIVDSRRLDKKMITFYADCLDMLNQDKIKNYIQK